MSDLSLKESICFYIVENGPVDPFEIFRGAKSFGFTQAEMWETILGLIDRGIFELDKDSRVKYAPNRENRNSSRN